jgi:hypothetical protein
VCSVYFISLLLLVCMLLTIQVAKGISRISLSLCAMSTRWLHYPVDDIPLKISILLLDNLFWLKRIILKLVTLKNKEPIKE